MKKLDGRSKAARALTVPIMADARQIGGSHYKDMGVQPWDAIYDQS